MQCAEVKTSCAVFRRFLEDPDLWVDGAYEIEALILVEGRRVRPEHRPIRSDARVWIRGGYVRRAPGRVPLAFFFHAWKLFSDCPALDASAAPAGRLVGKCSRPRQWGRRLSCRCRCGRPSPAPSSRPE